MTDFRWVVLLLSLISTFSLGMYISETVKRNKSCVEKGGVFVFVDQVCFKRESVLRYDY